MLKLFWFLIFVSFVPYLCKRKQEVDRQGNPTLRHWGTFFICIAGGVLFFWEAFKALHDTSLPKNSDDAIALFGIAMFCLMGSAYFFFSGIALFDSYIRLTILPLWTISYPLAEMTSIDETRKNIVVLHFSWKDCML
jgi:hypothetical protein